MKTTILLMFSLLFFTGSILGQKWQLQFFR